MTPRRITSYRGEPNAAPISMAQQASPHWYTHRLYERPRLNNDVNGLGMRPLSTNPMTSYPTQHALAPRVHEPKEQNEHEDTHLDETEAGIPLELRRPGEYENCLDVEHDEEQGEDVIADLALRPSLAHRVDAALVRGELVNGWFVGPDQRGNAQQQAREEQGNGPEPDDREVVAQELRHRCRRYYAA